METEKQKGGFIGAVESMARAAAKLSGEPEKSKPVAATQVDIEVKKAEARKLTKRLTDLADRPKIEAELQKIQPETANLKDAKARLSVALVSKNAGWLVTSPEQFQHNPDAANFAARITEADPKLQNDPYYLLSEGTKFFWQTRWADLTPEAYKEADSVMRSVRSRITELSKTNPDFKKDISQNVVREALIPEARMGMATGAAAVPQEVYNETDPTQETVIINADLIEELKKINYSLRHDEQFINDAHRLNNAKQEIIRVGREKNVPPNQIDEAIRRINPLWIRAQEGGRALRWDENLARAFMNTEHRAGDVIEFHYLKQEDLDLILRGREGQMEWLSKFRRSIFELGKEQSRPSLPDQSRWDEFERVVTWLWGDEREYIVKELKARWESYPRYDGVMKGLMYHPGDIKEKARALQFLTPPEMDELLDYEWAEYSRSLMSQSIKDILRNEAGQSFEDVEWLTEGVKERDPNDPKNPEDTKIIQLLKDAGWVDSHDASPEITKLIERVKAGQSKDFQDRIGKVFKDVKPGSVTRRQILHILELDPAVLNIANVNDVAAIKTRLNLLKMEIQIRQDRVGMGVLLRDYHMLSDGRLHNELVGLQFQYDQITAEIQDTSHPLNDVERAQREMTKNSLRSQLQEKWREYARNPHGMYDPDHGEILNHVKGLSPVEIRTRERLIALLKQKGLTDEQIRQQEWKIQDSLFAARNLVIGSGEAMEIGAKMGRAPTLDVETDEIKTKYVMEGAFAEPIQRVLNPELFADRFRMGGGKEGGDIRDIFYTIIFEQSGYDIMKDPKVPQRWKNRINEARRSGKQGIWRIYQEYAEEQLGISYSEMVRPEVLATGLQHVSTTWRGERTFLEALRERMVSLQRSGKLPEGAILDNEALAYQYIAAGEEDKARPIKQKILGRLLQRSPSLFFQNLGKEFDEMLGKRGIDSTSRDWQIFQDALSVAETRLWDDKTGLNVREVNFANRADFDLVILPILQELGMTDARTIDSFHRSILFMQEYMEGKSERWLDHKFSNIASLSLSDFNWKDVRITRLGMYTLERRINDFIGMSNAKDILFALLYDPALNSPEDFSKTLDKLMELRSTINGYAGLDAAEPAAQKVLDTLITFNSNMAADTVVGWIPGAVSLMRRMGTMKPEDIWPLRLIPGWKDKMEHYKIAGQPISKWPRSISQAVSYSTKHRGPEGNALDEFRRAGILARVRKIGMFTEHPELVGELERKHKTTLDRRIVATMRKYWWVVLLATIAVAVEAEITEEKKKH